VIVQIARQARGDEGWALTPSVATGLVLGLVVMYGTGLMVSV
jgi:hypothetical protein